MSKEQVNQREDSIIAEVREARDVHAQKFNYDVDAIVADLIEQQERRAAEGGCKLVSFPEDDDDDDTIPFGVTGKKPDQSATESS
ncbi:MULTISPECIES: hypothetical protein [Cyanophyceae]|uniref:Uncharacterized protein n=1 Tax=Leptolyngbya subtilissima DQ-A4 TaxID=2933933 RepID=A0ABV0KAE7_9CYAN|nr:hypothetical protein [Nodosilinea sp. FACHB-141]MBD2115187.1 hypothetical protein [Nodosilinea sp. FACHB-141]